MRQDIYEARRQQLIKQIRGERAKIMQEEINGVWSADYVEIDPDQLLDGTNVRTKSGHGKRNRSQASQDANSVGSPSRKGGKSSMIEKEMAQLEKIKAR